MTNALHETMKFPQNSFFRHKEGEEMSIGRQKEESRLPFVAMTRLYT